MGKTSVALPQRTAKRIAEFSLDIGTFLLSSGAHSGRVRTNIERMVESWGMEIDLSPSFKGLLVSVRDKENPENVYTSYRTSPTHVVRLANLTKISHLSWQVVHDCLPIEEAEAMFEKIKGEPRYPVWMVAIAVGISCSGLCLFSGGDWVNALVALLGALTGYLIQITITRIRFNPMVAVTAAASFTTLITGGAALMGLGSLPEAAMATSVLYLVPGVPLINSVIDLIEGYLTSSLNRAVFASFILLCIAVGMTISIGILGIHNF